MSTSYIPKATLHRSIVRLGKVWWRPTGKTVEVFIPGMDPGVWVELPLEVFDDLGDLQRSPWSDMRESKHGLHIFAMVNFSAENYGEVQVRPPFEIPREQDWDEYDLGDVE